jgi:hypothetical protein
VRSSTDRGKLDEYLTSVREVEKRVEGMRKGKEEADDAKAKNTVAPTMDRLANGDERPPQKTKTTATRVFQALCGTTKVVPAEHPG